MKIFEFLDFGNACGCLTVEDTYTFIDYHSPSMFSYGEIWKELSETLNELEKYGLASKEIKEDKTYWNISQTPLLRHLRL